MKKYRQVDEPVNILVDKDRTRALYITHFDYRQTSPRVTIGSTWIGTDKRYQRKFLLRVVETGYNTDYDLQRVLTTVRHSPDQTFSDRDLEYYCTEVVWLRLEGEIVNGRLQYVADQPTVLQTFLTPTSHIDELIIAAPESTGGFPIGNLRSGNRKLDPVVTIQDRFVGFRTLICGASGYGKSTLVRNLARYWLENMRYGVIIDDLKGEYVRDINNERNAVVSGLIHHPDAIEKLVVLTPFPLKYEELKGITVVPFEVDIDDIPPDTLKEVATHITAPQQQFLDMYSNKRNLFGLLLRENDDGSPFTGDWHKHFASFIIAIKEARSRISATDYETDLTDFTQSSYAPIFGILKHLARLVSMPFVKLDGKSCLPEIRTLLKDGKTIILDKNGLTEPQRMVASTILANELYKHNMRYSSAAAKDQANVIPFVYLVEEAHQLLSGEKAREGSIFVDFAKTGRSFSIGLVAVTQRPSSVDPNILSQFDNFITFQLPNEQDVKDLIRAKSEYRGFEEDIRSMQRGMAVAAFGEPTRVQTFVGFDWSPNRARTRVSKEEGTLLQKQQTELKRAQASHEGENGKSEHW